MDEEEPKKVSNAELCAMWLNDEIPLSEYMRNFKESSEILIFAEKQCAENRARMAREAKGIYPPTIWIVP